MSAFDGMDVNEVQDLASQLNSSAQALTEMASGVTGLAARLTIAWQGPASASFEQDWLTNHRPALNAAAQALSDAHGHLATNLSQQITASAAEGGYGATSLGATVRADIAKVWDGVQKVQQWAMIPEYLIGKEEKLFGHTTDPDVPKLQDAKVVRWLRDTPALRGIDDVLVKTHVYKVLDKVAEPVAIGIAVGSVSVDLAQAHKDQEQGNLFGAANQLTDAAADGVGAVPVVGWAGDFVTELAKNDIDEIVTGGPIDSPFSWQNLKEDYAPLPAEMWQQLLTDKGELVSMAFGGHGSDG